MDRHAVLIPLPWELALDEEIIALTKFSISHEYLSPIEEFL